MSSDPSERPLMRPKLPYVHMVRMAAHDPKRTLFALTAETEAKRPARVSLTAAGLSALRRRARQLPVAAFFFFFLWSSYRHPAANLLGQCQTGFGRQHLRKLFLSSPGETPLSGLFFVLEARRWWSEKFVLISSLSVKAQCGTDWSTTT